MSRTELRGETLRRICRAYREASVAYDRAFARGDIGAIEDAFSRMQEIARAFDQGAAWERRQVRLRAVATEGAR